MGSSYVYGHNPFRDFLLESIRHGVDIGKKGYKLEINSSFILILENVLNNGKEAVHLDFEIIDNNGHYKIIGKNAPSALWLSGILVENVDDMFAVNKFEIGDRIYKYNKKTGCLTFTIKK